MLITFEEVTTILPSLLGQHPADEASTSSTATWPTSATQVPAGSLDGREGHVRPGLSLDTITDFTGRAPNDSSKADEGNDRR